MKKLFLSFLIIIHGCMVLSQSINGDNCSNSIPIDDSASTFTVASMALYTSSTLQPPCFASNTQRDIFLSFTILQAGTIEWIADPFGVTEFDFALRNTTNGCPGTIVSCNYYYSGNGANFGMGGTADLGQINARVNALPGETYALQIDNYSTNANGFTFTWQGTALLGGSPTTVTPTINYDEFNISIFPNPSNGLTSVAIPPNSSACFRVFDSVGNIIESGKENNKFNIDLSSASSGIYFVEVSNEQYRITKKIILMK